MRTRAARRVEKQYLRTAKMQGHIPALITEAGALHLYGCQRPGCSATLECWDAPAVAGGAMVQSACREGMKQSRFIRLRRKVWFFITEGRWT